MAWLKRDKFNKMCSRDVSTNLKTHRLILFKLPFVIVLSVISPWVLIVLFFFLCLVMCSTGQLFVGIVSIYHQYN